MKQSSPPTIMVCGGAGYIGSHTCKLIKQNGFTPITYDNLSSGHKHAVQWGPLIEGDIADGDALIAAMNAHRPTHIIHFAGDIEVGKSLTHPDEFYHNNLTGSLSILRAMKETGIQNIVFSSSAAVYGTPDQSPIPESAPKAPINPYGRSKLMVEDIMADYAAAYDINTVALRYFNACGAHPDGDIGEEHNPETHLIPRILMAVTGDIETLHIYGDDYNTPDGTCIRDYIHVQDLAEAHLKAVNYLSQGHKNAVFNLGTGQGYSVQQIIGEVERITGQTVPRQNHPRRAGDPARLIADATLAKQVLNFTPTHSDLETIIKTTWAFHQSKTA